MKKGFTIIELLVASMLLGMLVTILTMVFNQSSIAWRTGVAGNVDLGDIRREIAEVRDQADSIFIANNETHCIQGIWDQSGNLRTRACDVGGGSSIYSAFNNFKDTTVVTDLSKPILLQSSASDTVSHHTYIVNVMSAGPDRIFDTYDDIWSFPDEFQ